jgi:murein DD-endopeptidase MepM/ murein hydrolase activator NlpD
VKKNKFTEFFKGKGYYVLLFVGVIAIAAVALIGSNLSSRPEDKEDNIVDLNEPDNNIAAEDENDLQADNNTVQDDVVNNEQGDNVAAGTETDEDAGQEVADNNEIEYEDYSMENEDSTDLAQTDETEDVAEEEEEPEAVETTGTTVEADNIPLLDSLSFNPDKGLLWPVQGNVIMNYSMDHTIYHATLMLYKCNPAIIIDAEVGTEVKAAAAGIISSIEDTDETGLTITTKIGDSYSLVYGQLKDVSLEVGDTVDEGDVIGLIQEPSKYYSVEGSNLYFKVLENEQTVNPMKLLR